MKAKRVRYLKNSILAAVVLVGAAGPALARQDPPPPPSGIVVHLFGPGSLTSNILPGPVMAPAGGAPAGGATLPGDAPVAEAPAVAPQPGATGQYVEPSLHDVLHQMFVTGDPDQQPGESISTGRTVDRLSR